MTTNISSIKVPHYGPEDARILFVGEAPGEDEEIQGKPFVGVPGQLLRDVLVYFGFEPEDARYANLCNYHPLHNNFNFVYRSAELEEGKRELAEFIDKHKLNVIVPLGKEALSFLTGKGGKGSITTWRGSIIPCILNPNIKCIPTYHPSYVLRDQSNLPIFQSDIHRILDDSKYSDFNYPIREFIINPSGLELENWVHKLSESAKLGTDIESSKKTKELICISFSPNPFLSVVIYFDSIERNRAIGRILESNAEKIFHFGIFDNLMLHRQGFPVNNYKHDTYIAQRILNAEQSNSLAFLTSMYTREPYYKTEGRATIPSDTKIWSESSVSKEALGIYNGKDSAVTIQIHLEQIKELEEEKLMPVYENNMEQQEMAIHISESGLLIDEERRHLIERALLKQWDEKQQMLNFLCNQVVNVNSPKLKNVLYKDIGLPERKKRNQNGVWTVTTDENALVATIAYVKNQIDKLKKEESKKPWQIKEAICKLIIQIRGIRKLLSTYIKTKENVRDLYGEDYRVRSTYKVGGAATLRYSAEMFVDDTGINGQTTPREAVKIPANLDKEDSSFVDLIIQLRDDKNKEEELEEAA